jgi:hypothetical protein
MRDDTPLRLRTRRPKWLAWSLSTACIGAWWLRDFKMASPRSTMSAKKYRVLALLTAK